MNTIDKFILANETFKLGRFEKAPKAEQNTALVLYRERDGIQSGMVILPEQIVVSGKILREKFDKKMVVDLSKRDMNLEMKIKAQEEYCFFLVNINIEYAIRDVKYAISNELETTGNVINEKVREILNVYQQKFRIEDETELEREIQCLSSQLAGYFEYLYIHAVAYVRLNENGQKMYDSYAKLKVDTTIRENASELEKQNKRLEGELIRTGYEEAIKTTNEKIKLNQAKIQEVQGLSESFGEDGILVSAYFNGKIGEIELNEKLRKQRAETEEKRFQELKELYKMGIVTDENINNYASQVVFGKCVVPSVEEKKNNAIEQKDKIEIEDGEQIGNYLDDRE